MTYRRLVGLVTALTCSLNATLAQAAVPTSVKSRIDRQETPDRIRESMVLPYLFSTETMGLNVGVGGMIKGIHQDQMTIGGTVFGGDTSHAIAGGVWNYMIPGTERVFLSAYGMFGYYPQQRAYTTGTESYPPGSPLPGSNGSSNDQFFQADGASNWFDIKMEYVLPIGSTRNDGRVDYKIRNGLLVSEPLEAKSGIQWKVVPPFLLLANSIATSRLNLTKASSMAPFTLWSLASSMTTRTLRRTRHTVAAST